MNYFKNFYTTIDTSLGQFEIRDYTIIDTDILNNSHIFFTSIILYIVIACFIIGLSLLLALVYNYIIKKLYNYKHWSSKLTFNYNLKFKNLKVVFFVFSIICLIYDCLEYYDIDFLDLITFIKNFYNTFMKRGESGNIGSPDNTGSGKSPPNAGPSGNGVSSDDDDDDDEDSNDNSINIKDLRKSVHDLNGRIRTYRNRFKKGGVTEQREAALNELIQELKKKKEILEKIKSLDNDPRLKQLWEERLKCWENYRAWRKYKLEKGLLNDGTEPVTEYIYRDKIEKREKEMDKIDPNYLNAKKGVKRMSEYKPVSY